MNEDNIAIGIDIEENARFEGKNPKTDSAFLNKIFTKKELEYCFKDKQSAKHLCARFCAKEAAVKALHSLGIKGIYYKDIEITNNDDGVPSIEISGIKGLKTKVSISHCKTVSTANVLIFKE